MVHRERYSVFLITLATCSVNNQMALIWKESVMDNLRKLKIFHNTVKKTNKL
jgi:hypothetical protein